MNTPSTHSTEAGFRGTRTSGARRLKVGLAAVVVFLTTFGGLTVAGITPVSASTLDGTATIATPGSDTPLASGGSQTPFTVTLSPNPATPNVPAACTGDTASDGYLVYSYMVPEGTSPTWVNYLTGQPSRGYALLSPPHTELGPINTAATTGEIINIPNTLEFAPLRSIGITLDQLLYSDGNTSGVWETGIACALHGVVTDYWNTEVTLTASASDPEGFVWSATAGPCVPATAGFYSASSATFPHGATSTFTAESKGCSSTGTAPTITETGALPAGVKLDSSGDGILSGSPTVGGTFKITLVATVTGDAPVDQSFTLTVPLFVTTTTVPEAKPGVKYTTTLKASGGKTPYTWTETTKLPTTLKLTLSSAGVLSGTVPKTVKAGSYKFTVKVTDDSSPTKKTATESYTLKVS